MQNINFTNSLEQCQSSNSCVSVLPVASQEMEKVCAKRQFWNSPLYDVTDGTATTLIPFPD